MEVLQDLVTYHHSSVATDKEVWAQKVRPQAATLIFFRSWDLLTIFVDGITSVMWGLISHGTCIIHYDLLFAGKWLIQKLI